MSNDFGVRRRRRSRLWTILGAVIAACMVAYAAVDAIGDHLQQGASERKAVRDWTIAGPPCPVSSQAAVAQSGVKLSKAFEFAGVTFARGYGDVACHEFHTGARDIVGGDLVCQFTGPSALRVTTAKGDAYFLLGGQKATVAIKDGAARCVMAANYQPSVDAP